MAKAKKISLDNQGSNWYDETIGVVQAKKKDTHEKERGDIRVNVPDTSGTKQSEGLPLPVDVGRYGVDAQGDTGVDLIGDRAKDEPGSPGKGDSLPGNSAGSASVHSAADAGGNQVAASRGGDDGQGDRLSPGVGGSGDDDAGSGDADEKDQSGRGLLVRTSRNAGKTGFSFAASPEFNEALATRGNRQRFLDNLAAIRLLRRLLVEKRLAKAGEQETLAKFSGWGSFRAIFIEKSIPIYVSKTTPLKSLDERVGSEQLSYEQRVELENSGMREEVEEAFKNLSRGYQPHMDDKARTQLENRKLFMVEMYGLARAIYFSKHHQDLEVPDSTGRARAEHKETLAELYKIYDAARASTLSAHFTPPVITHAMWEGVTQMGLRGRALYAGIRVVEPALGSGAFISSAPAHLRSNANFCGIELDEVTALISKNLFQKEDIRQSGFESAPLVDDFFDLAISNVPFGDYKVFDPKWGRHNLSVHNYFFLKGLDKVKPGGLMAFITSSFTMDAEGNAHRKLIAERAELVAAVRLPNTAFSSAGTKVVADILFLRKRLPNEVAQPTEAQWAELSEIKTKDGLDAEINEYFISHPSMVMGEMVSAKSIYTADETEVTVEPSPGWELRLQKTMRELPSTAYRVNAALDVKPDEYIAAPSNTKNGNLLVRDDRVYQNIGGILEWREDLSKRAPMVRALAELRDWTRDHLSIQGSVFTTDDIFEASKANLNRLYDEFVAAHGHLNSKKLRKVVIEELDSPLLFSLEKWDESTQQAEKSSIFSIRTANPSAGTLTVQTVSDALLLSLREHGEINIPFMAEQLHRDEVHVVDELLSTSAAFIDPSSGRLEEGDRYLSGNVREKLQTAQTAAMTDSVYSQNVKALKAVQPEFIPVRDISIRLGASWIPKEVIESFVRDISGVTQSARSVEVLYTESTAEWRISFDEGSSGHPKTFRNTTENGTAAYPASKLIEMALNQKQPTVYLPKNPNVDAPRKVDAAQTADVRERQGKLKAMFTSFVQTNEEWARAAERAYNEKINTLRLREYSGKHLTLPGMTSAFVPRDSQKDAIWRIASSEHNVLLDHCVGAGKTATLIGGAMEMRRTGKAKKPMLLVPNNMLEQMAGDFAMLYPNARILVAHQQFLGKDQRRLFQAQIATGDWDSIIISYSAFEKIAVKPETHAAYIQEQVDLVADSIAAMDTGDKRLLKRLEKKKKNLEVKINTLLNQSGKDSAIYFEDLGIDMLMVDEADNFKNLGFETKMQRIPGLSDVRSARAEDLFMKTGLVNKIVFATGTSISNSIAEMYTMMRYLLRDKMREHGIYHFDEWAATFADTVTTLEMSPDGGGYRMATRFARFNNLPELMSLYKIFSDIKTKHMLKLPTPMAEIKAVAAKSTPILEAYVKELVARAEKIKSGKVDPSEDNMLKVTSDGRKAALDMRLIDQKHQDNPDSKLNIMVGNIWSSYQSGRDTDLLQMVFCDMGTPGGTALEAKFSLYDDIRNKLVMMGVKPEEVRFAQEAKDSNELEQIFAQARMAKIRVLIGSTIKMGAGTNVQKYLSDIHHLDCPWRPRDIEQRDGRGERQGNLNKTVRLWRYVTEKSFDVYLWQLVETKMRFIDQIRNGDSKMRSIEDISSRALSFAEIKALATGNPMVIEKSGIEQEIAHLELLESGFCKNRYLVESRLSFLESVHESKHRQIDAMRQDTQNIRSTRAELFFMSFDKVVINKQEFPALTTTDREGAGARLTEMAMAEVKQKTNDSKGDYRVGEIGGMELRYSRVFDQIEFMLKGTGEYTTLMSNSALGSVRKIENLLVEITTELPKMEESILKDQSEIESLKTSLSLKFEHGEKLYKLTSRLSQINTELGLLDNEAGTSGADEDDHEATVATDGDATDISNRSGQ